MYKLVFYIAVVCIALTSCNKQEKKFVKKSMYVWKAVHDLDSTDIKFFHRNNIENLYIRFFDVGWDEKHGPVPKGKIVLNNLMIQDINVIPVIYIENSIFYKMEKLDIPVLADKIFKKAYKIYNYINPGGRPAEIQLDCDWSESTKKLYFDLVNEIKAKSQKTMISATIRLHQIKYKDKTGVPPADKGVLMYYNMGDIKDINEPNSILNTQVGGEYINDKSRYPLSLSLALPIYSWSVWYRNNQFMGLIGKLNENNIDNIKFLNRVRSNVYMVNKDIVFYDSYLRKGDIIKLEKTHMDEIEIAKKQCLPMIQDTAPEFILFSYSPENTSLINEEDLNRIYSIN